MCSEIHNDVRPLNHLWLFARSIIYFVRRQHCLWYCKSADDCKIACTIGTTLVTKKKSTARSLIPQAKFGGHARQSTLQGYRAKPLLSTASNATKRVAACIGTMCGARREAIIKPTGRAPEDCSVQICVRRRAEEPIADDTAARSLSWAPAARSSFYAPRTRPPRVDCSLGAERRGDRRKKKQIETSITKRTSTRTERSTKDPSPSSMAVDVMSERERELGLQKRWKAWPIL